MSSDGSHPTGFGIPVALYLKKGLKDGLLIGATGAVLYAIGVIPWFDKLVAQLIGTSLPFNLIAPIEFGFATFSVMFLYDLLLGFYNNYKSNF
jgi:hypothetical protein